MRRSTDLSIIGKDGSEMLERVKIAIAFWWYLPPWDREKEYIKGILERVNNGYTLTDLINEYEEE